MTDRVLHQNCPDHDGCVRSMHIQDSHTFDGLDQAGGVDIVDVFGRVRATTSPGQTEISVTQFHASLSHSVPGFELAHLECRIGAHPAVHEDHRGAEPGGVLQDPPIITGQKMCADCHVIFGHEDVKHLAAGVGRKPDGTRQVHDSHPSYAAGETAGHETHQGDSFGSCERCAPKAASCSGCYNSLVAG